MSTAKRKIEEQLDSQVCEVCNGDVPPKEQPLSGCNRCGRLFGPCCNSQDPDLCVECV